MSNPFDQFSLDVTAALPTGAPGAPPQSAANDGNPFASVFADAPAAPPPPSNQPVMNTFQPPPQPMGGGMNGMAGGMGGPPPPQMGAMQNEMGGMGMGMGMMGQPPPPQQLPPQAPPTPQHQSNPMTMYGQPSMGSPPAPTNPPAAADPFGGYGQPAPPAPSAQAGGGFGLSDSFLASPPAAGVPGAPPPPSPNPYGVPPAPIMSAGSPNPYGGAPAPIPNVNDPFGGGAAPAAGPPPNYGNPYGAPPPQQQQNAGPFSDPFGAPSAASQPPPSFPPTDPNMGALVVSNQPSNPYAQALPPQQQQQLALPPAPASNDPFAVFNSAPAPPPPPSPRPSFNNTAIVPAQAQPQQQQPQGDLWGDLGFDAPPDVGPSPPQGQQQRSSVISAVGSVNQEEKKAGDLPPGGEFYDARIFTPTLGVMFFKPQELTDSLFLNTDRSIVDSLSDRPVVAFIVEGSSARSAGVELGHVLLKVNGVDVKNPKEASRLIKEGPRPLPLLFYVPNTDVVVAEGEHMVKYDTKDTTAPSSSKDWKPKYVVIGGIIAQPWMINMYRSKSEYDIAVIETQARRPVSVKVKQFSLQGARIQNDWQGPQMVKYKNKLQPWKYIVCLPVARNPIKISSPNLSQLKPVHEGIRRVLLAQQRSGGRGGGRNSGSRSSGQSSSNNQNNRSAAPQRRDSYNQQQSSNQIVQVQQPQQQQYNNYGQPPPPPQHMQQQQQYPPQPPPQQQQQQQQYAQHNGYAQQQPGYPPGY